jgi:hypothetical protein
VRRVTIESSFRTFERKNAGPRGEVWIGGNTERWSTEPPQFRAGTARRSGVARLPATAWSTGLITL